MEDAHDSVMNVAHRGGAGLCPENTLAAIRNAIALKCDAAELDVQLTRDGAVVVHHDVALNPDLTRDETGAWLSGRTPLLRDLPLDELRRFDIGRARPGSAYAARHPALQAVEGARIPLLHDVVALAETAPGFLLFVELKAGGVGGSDPIALADATLKVVRDTGFLSRTIFIGFEWNALARIRMQDAAAQIWCDTGEAVPGNDLVFQAIRASGAQGWLPHHAQVTADAVAGARHHDLQIAPWTVNDPVDMARLLALGVDGICTDRPDLLQTFE